jgi:hypothetical protein
MKSLDAWITGNYGYDHPDNYIACEECGREVLLTSDNEDDTHIWCDRCIRKDAEGNGDVYGDD